MIGIAEGLSFILLLMAMPVKYVFGYPGAVKLAGWLHGILFILYVVMLIRVQLSYQWPLKKILLAFLASLLPFGTFLLDSRLQIEEDQLLLKEVEVKK